MLLKTTNDNGNTRSSTTRNLMAMAAAGRHGNSGTQRHTGTRQMAELRFALSGGVAAVGGSSNYADSQNRKKIKRWSREEDEKLLRAIDENGPSNWTMIAQIVGGGRTRSQCAQRWSRGLRPDLSHDEWSQEDDISLLRLVKEHGTKAWVKIAQLIGDRCDVQCRYRYNKIRSSPNLRVYASSSSLDSSTSPAQRQSSADGKSSQMTANQTTTSAGEEEDVASTTDEEVVTNSVGRNHPGLLFPSISLLMESANIPVMHNFMF